MEFLLEIKAYARKGERSKVDLLDFIDVFVSAAKIGKAMKRAEVIKIEDDDDDSGDGRGRG